MTEKGIQIDWSQFLLAASEALDLVEEQVLGVALHHSKRVGYLSALVGQRMGLATADLVELIGFALLHDNALTELVATQRRLGIPPADRLTQENMRAHCIVGEQNLVSLPFVHQGEKVVLYHHENYDGSGMFHLRGEEIPLMARLLRTTDNIDLLFPLDRIIHPGGREPVLAHLREESGRLYDPEICALLAPLLEQPQVQQALCDDRVIQRLYANFPSAPRILSYEELIRASALFAHIVDCKSPFTARHSAGIAEKAKRMAAFYGFRYDMANQFYVAAYLHDLGKLAVPDDLLEKPGKLSPQEYEIVKRHMWMTHQLLGMVSGFEQIEHWASRHHERLDGSGYFRGERGEQLDFCSRLLACIDVYQALVEDRPYRVGMRPERAFSVLRVQAEAGKLDGAIIEDMSAVFLMDRTPVYTKS